MEHAYPSIYELDIQLNGLVEGALLAKKNILETSYVLCTSIGGATSRVRYKK